MLNNANEKGAGFNTDTNHITIIKKDGEVVEYPTKDKMSVASDIIDQLLLIDDK